MGSSSLGGGGVHGHSDACSSSGAVQGGGSVCGHSNACSSLGAVGDGGSGCHHSDACSSLGAGGVEAVVIIAVVHDGHIHGMEAGFSLFYPFLCHSIVVVAQDN